MGVSPSTILKIPPWIDQRGARPSPSSAARRRSLALPSSGLGKRLAEPGGRRVGRIDGERLQAEGAGVLTEAAGECHLGEPDVRTGVRPGLRSRDPLLGGGIEEAAMEVDLGERL